MKKAAALMLAFLLWGCSAGNQVIGTVEGPEWDRIIIDGIEYIPESAAPTAYDIHSSADAGSRLGIIKCGDTILQVYSVKGDEAGNYLYVRWEWEGEIYIREDVIQE